MVQISKRKLDDYILERLEKVLFDLLGKKKSKKEFDNVMESLFSSTERVMILKRVGLIYLHLKNIEKYRIRKTLGVTDSTLDKYKLLIEKNPTIYERFFSIINKDNIKVLFEQLWNYLYGPGTPGIDWSAAWERKKRLKRKKEEGI